MTEMDGGTHVDDATPDPERVKGEGAGHPRPLRVRWGRAAFVTPHSYRVADRLLIANTELPGLDGFEVDNTRSLVESDPPRLRSVKRSGRSQRCFDAAVMLGSCRVHLRVHRTPASFLITIDDLPPFEVASGGSTVSWPGPDSEAGSPQIVEGFLGPALVLALALGETFCLHASAVARGGRVVALLGDSCAGKSTLARELEVRSGGEWRRVADDVLPLRLEGSRVVVLPRFPQLKLPVSRQPWQDLPDRLPLAGALVVSPTDARSPLRCDIELLTGLERAAAIVAHTVSARLFDADLLASHLALCSAVGLRVPVSRLVYPHRGDSIDAVRSLLEAERAA